MFARGGKVVLRYTVHFAETGESLAVRGITIFLISNGQVKNEYAGEIKLRLGLYLIVPVAIQQGKAHLRGSGMLTRAVFQTLRELSQLLKLGHSQCGLEWRP